jgi:DNA repair photolyase
MEYKHVRCNSLLNSISNKDYLFFGDYTMDPYQNCEFGCKYCDSSFDKIIYIKNNAVDLLKKEIKKVKKGMIIVGSVNDPYQQVEMKYETTRKLLKIIKNYDYPCHILTKSKLILRDIDILSKMRNCIVTISISTFDNFILDFIEKKVPSPKERLQIIKKLSSIGIKTGLAVIPLLPFIVEDELDKIFKIAIKYKADYILYKYLELKGDQKTFFLETLNKFKPELIKKYRKLYDDNYMPDQEYKMKIRSSFNNLFSKYNINNKVYNI